MIGKRNEALIQIILLIGMTFAFCYFIHESDGLINNKDNNNKTNNLIFNGQEGSANNNFGALMWVYKILIKILFSEK